MKDAGGHGSNARGGSDMAGGHLPVWYHGSPTGFPGATGQIHLGTREVARIALEARIGIPADGLGWTGNREYGKTLLAGENTLKDMESGKRPYFDRYPRTGYNADAPKEDYFPTKMPIMGRDRTPMSPTMMPAVRQYQIAGAMKNNVSTPYTDGTANRLANAQQTRGNGVHGFYYRNTGEGTGTISAVVPNRNHLVGRMG